MAIISSIDGSSSGNEGSQSSFKSKNNKKREKEWKMIKKNIDQERAVHCLKKYSKTKVMFIFKDSNINSHLD